MSLDPRARPSLRSIFDTELDFVLRNLARLGVPPHELEDAAQETFVVVHRRLGDLRPGAPLRPWLYGVVRKIASRQRRGAQRRRRLHHALSVEVPRPSVPSGFECTEGRPLLREFLHDTLWEDARAVFILVELEGLQLQEVAQQLTLNINTAGARLRAARREFRRFCKRVRAREAGELLWAERKASASDRADASMRRRVAALLPFHGPLGFVSAQVSKAVVASCALVVATLAVVPAERPPPVTVADVDADTHDDMTDTRVAPVAVRGPWVELPSPSPRAPDLGPPTLAVASLEARAAGRVTAAKPRGRIRQSTVAPGPFEVASAPDAVAPESLEVASAPDAVAPESLEVAPAPEAVASGSLEVAPAPEAGAPGSLEVAPAIDAIALPSRPGPSASTTATHRAKSPAVGLQQEARLLLSARQHHQRGNDAEAKRLLATYDERFAHGVLRPEAHALREALERGAEDRATQARRGGQGGHR